MRRGVLLLFLMLVMIGTGYYFTIYYPLKPEVVVNGNISGNEEVAYNPSNVKTQYNESKIFTLRLGECKLYMSGRYINALILYTGVVEGKGTLAFKGDSIVLYVSIGSTVFLDLYPVEVLELENDYIKLYDIEGVIVPLLKS